MTNSTDFGFIKLDELFKQPLEIDWLIEDIIPSNSIGMIYGASGSGKSHIILSMATMIANGLQWFGKDTKQGNVIVLAGEGLRGLHRRLKAIEIEHGLAIDRDKFDISNMAIGLDTKDGRKTVERKIQELKTPPKLIFIDTLSRHLMQSEENSNDDMARLINKLEQMRQKYGCTIILVHHTGKGEKLGARGASALKANIDFSFKVAGEDKRCSFSCDKMKDADDSMPDKRFEIKAVDLGKVDKKGKPITGACVVASSAPTILKVQNKTKEELALDCFKTDKKEWQKAYVAACKDAVSEDTKKRQFRDARKTLIADSKVIKNADGSFSLVEAA